MFDKLSEELKAARIRAGLSLQQLAAKTRIDLKFLEYIEDGNFSFLPELYVKAFLKEYIKFVGLEEKLVFKKYEAYKLGKEYVEPAQETLLDKIKELKENKVEKEKVNPYSKPVSYQSSPPTNPLNTFLMDKKNLLFASVVVGVMIIFFAVYFIFIKRSPDIIVEKPYDELVNESKERYIEDEPKKLPVDSNAGNSTKSDTLKLLVTANDSCWVKALIDDSIKEEFKLIPHGHKLLSAVSNFKITFGNSSRIQLQLNNKPLNFEAKSKVSFVSIDAKGLNYLNSTINPKK
jgi:transcriptional regulator with XRE-family HTH domain